MTYENNWNSLNTRAVPAWFGDAKFGIFIHWGLYSVPAYTERGKYAEWYGKQLENDALFGDANRTVVDFHQRVYGKDFKYADFVHQFKAELFCADEWLDLFQKAGAKYINLVSKHHDGFCLYKSSYAPFWNSVDVGPHRDFCAELKAACEKTDIRFGVYHSVYEWWNPYYLRNPEEYAVKHLIPMLKELVENYQPNTLFTDGEWEHPSSVWHSTEFLQWLYNESPVKDIIVPNDRWGNDTRGKFGGNFTTEYGEVGFGMTMNQEDKRPFEECRGIGKSFGFNRIEGVEDYMSADDLIGLLVSIVAKGGNLLLNIGPAADGTIPVIMQERLLQMGEWLSVNGEAIYGSREYSVHSDDRCDYTQNHGHIYAITAEYPEGEMSFESIPYQTGAKVILLGCELPESLFEVFEKDGKMAVKLPFITPKAMKSKGYFTYRITF